MIINNSLYYIFCILFFSALAIFPQNPITKMGYKNGSSTDCNNTNGEDMIQCLEKRAYSIEDIFPFNRRYLEMKHLYVSDRLGLAVSVKIETGVISKSAQLTLNIKMNPNTNYYALITDSKLQSTSNNLDLVPRTAIILEKNAGTANIVLKEIIINIFKFCVK